jgi:DNA-binding beta-propeller fold protein YncE
MNKRWTTITIILLILVFTGYIVVDSALKRNKTSNRESAANNEHIPDRWVIINEFSQSQGHLNSVTIAANSMIVTGGDSSVTCYDNEFRQLWNHFSGSPVTALASYGVLIYAAAGATILVLDLNGKKTDEWGPFGENTLITSLTASKSYVAYADAANKIVFVLDHNGMVKHMAGESGSEFIIPSPYFDVALGNDNILYVANTGNKRIERRNIDGTLIDFFGESGSGPEDFCGCCNPAHFAIFPGGFVTAEKGINRLKILDEKGEFIEFVSSTNKFKPSIPLDVISSDGKLIYAANPSDGKIYVFERKVQAML